MQHTGVLKWLYRASFKNHRDPNGFRLGIVAFRVWG